MMAKVLNKLRNLFKVKKPVVIVDTKSEERVNKAISTTSELLVSVLKLRREVARLTDRIKKLEDRKEGKMDELVYESLNGKVKVVIEDNYYLVLKIDGTEVERAPLEGVTTLEELDKKINYLLVSIKSEYN